MGFWDGEIDEGGCMVVVGVLEWGVDVGCVGIVLGEGKGRVGDIGSLWD